ncbi:MAG: helix-hairpin-helix domain-containing protein [Acidobacteriaceae bacterium]
MRGRIRGEMMVRVTATLGLCVALLWVASCSVSGHESDRQIQHQAQQATEQAKAAAQKAAADARVAAANAERDAHDVAKGVRAGLHNGKAGSDLVNLNTATRGDLESLPGVTPTTARHIAENRPYDTTHDLVRKGVVSQAEYDRIAGQVATR